MLRIDVIMILMKQAYKMILRGLLLDFVEKTENDWDNRLVDIIDDIFDYEEG